MPDSCTKRNDLLSLWELERPQEGEPVSLTSGHGWRTQAESWTLALNLPFCITYRTGEEGPFPVPGTLKVLWLALSDLGLVWG